MKQKICMLLVALATLTLFGACNNDNEPTNDSFELSVTPEMLQLGVGVQKQLTITPEGISYSCSSSDESVATVDYKGVVTGVKEGEAVITVMAKEQTKTVKVVVGNRYMGLYSGDDMIAPIYIPFFPDLAVSKEAQKQVIAANEKYDWELFSYDDGDDDHNDDGDTGDHSHKMIQMRAPKHENGAYMDNRLITDLYYHYMKADDIYFDCWTRPLFKKDVVQAAHDGSEKDIKLLRDILILYGFTENVQPSKYKSGQLNFEGYNMTQFPEGPMWGSIYCTKIESTDSYYLEFQVVQRAPKK